MVLYSNQIKLLRHVVRSWMIHSMPLQLIFVPCVAVQQPYSSIQTVLLHKTEVVHYIRFGG